MPPADTLMNSMRSGTLSRIFPQLGFFAVFSIITNFAGRISEAAMGAVLRVKKRQVCAVNGRARAERTN